MVSSISSKSDSIQVVYDNYLKGRYIVNRRYQRKLVWSQEEKVAFIDSIRQHYSVPLFLLAQNTDADGTIQYEIIDGMQRLNSIVSFIENEFAIHWNGDLFYFNLDSLASTLDLKNQKILTQRTPVLPRDICIDIVSYQLPFSFIIADQKSIEEIFRRINSYGKQLSNQEIRQAGAIGLFSDIVRKVASTIRGDVSSTDILSLNDMTKISLSNTRLKYGINIHDIWWVRQHVITLANMRVSRDEELIAWIISYIIMGKNVAPSSKALNRLYRYDLLDKEGNNQAALAESRIRELGEQFIVSAFCRTFSTLLDILHTSNKDFRTLIYTEDEGESLVRTFQVIFLALYELIVKENKVIVDIKTLANHLNSVGMSHLRGIAKENWTAETRYNHIQAIKGIMSQDFRQGTGEDAGADNWVLQLDNIMRLSSLENTQYDFKSGFHNFSDSSFNRDLVRKCIKTLTAAVNKGPNTKGFVIVGVCETESTFKQFQTFYRSHKGQKFQNTDFYITGIDDEAQKFYSGNFDRFQREIIKIIEQEPIEEYAKQYILTHIWFPRYYDVTVMVLELQSDKTPLAYADTYYERHGNNLEEVKGIKAIKAVEDRFK